MDSIKQQLNGRPVMSQVVKYALITIGAAIGAVGFQFFMFPNAIVSGGLIGIAQIVNRLTGLPVGAFSIGGVIKGLGLGTIYYVGATTGGVDIVARFLRRRFPYINFGTLILLMDAVIIAAYAWIFKIYESAMYSLICMFVMSRAVDLVLYGLDNSNICYSVSEHTDDIVSEITLGQLHRGVTLLHAEGAYSHEEKQVIMCVIKRPQIAAIRRMVRAIDPKAFMVVTDAKNVFGKGFDRIIENS